MSAQLPPPALRIVRGDPTPEEIAALVAVLAAAAPAEAAEESAVGQPQSEWGAPTRVMRQPIAPTGWWGSALPR
ncbi:MAG: acyl-CoA carboxylase epsilon subunit [Candidatus Nanopelagicales bacterium]